MDDLPDPLSDQALPQKYGERPLLPLKERLECQKLLAEIEKVQAETAELQRALWKKPSFYAAIAPVVLVLVGLVYSWLSGWFDTQQKKLDAQKTLLEFEVKQLESRKAEYLLTITNLAHSNAVATQLAFTLSNKVVSLTGERDDLNRLKNLLQGQVEAFAGADNNFQVLLVEFARNRQQTELYRGLAAHALSELFSDAIAFSAVTNSISWDAGQSLLRFTTSQHPAAQLDTIHERLVEDASCDPSFIELWTADRGRAVQELIRVRTFQNPSLTSDALRVAFERVRPATPQNFRFVMDP